jgi:WD40 repeat protein
VQSFNADGSRLIVYGTEGSWYLYDARSLAPIGEIPIGVEPRWDADDPNLLYYFDDISLLRYDIGSGETSLVHDFRADFPDLSLSVVWTRYEGSPSWDGRYWGLMGQDHDWEVVIFLVYDLQEDQVVAERRLPGGAEVDSVAISPLGTYFLAYFDNYCERGNPGDDRDPCGLMVYDQNLENGRSLVRIIGHSDPALDPEGREVLVYQGIDSDTISMLDLASGEVTELWPIDFSHTAIGLHFSGRSFDAPGWVLVSTYGDDARAYTWMDNAVFAVELRLNGRVVRLAHTHSLVDENQDHDYWAEPHASVNHDFTRILFTSNWGRSGTGEVDIYLISLPPGWMDRLP